jgi:hypothetical protein
MPKLDKETMIALAIVLAPIVAVFLFGMALVFMKGAPRGPYSRQ